MKFSKWTYSYTSHPDKEYNITRTPESSANAPSRSHFRARKGIFVNSKPASTKIFPVEIVLKDMSIIWYCYYMIIYVLGLVRFMIG